MHALNTYCFCEQQKLTLEKNRKCDPRALEGSWRWHCRVGNHPHRVGLRGFTWESPSPGKEAEGVRLGQGEEPETSSSEDVYIGHWICLHQCMGLVSRSPWTSSSACSVLVSGSGNDLCIIASGLDLVGCLVPRCAEQNFLLAPGDPGRQTCPDFFSSVTAPPLRTCDPPHTHTHCTLVTGQRHESKDSCCPALHIQTMLCSVTS